MSKRWKEVKCHYRVVGTEAYTTLNMTAKSEDKKKIIFTCVIPPREKVGSAVEYYFDWVFDGKHDRREGGCVKIEQLSDKAQPPT